MIKTCLHKRQVFLKKTKNAAACSAINRVRGPQSTSFQKRRFFLMQRKSACGRLFSRKHGLGLPVHIKIAFISINMSSIYPFCINVSPLAIPNSLLAFIGNVVLHRLSKCLCASNGPRSIQDDSQGPPLMHFRE